jgi:hypothetical protein
MPYTWGKCGTKSLLLSFLSRAYSITLKVSIYAELKGNSYSTVSEEM